jgi:hypothetical protein
VDVVYGPKGSGKSAIYSLLLRRAQELRDHGIYVISAENPRGAPVFKDLVADPPTNEDEFRGLWKLYFLALCRTFWSGVRMDVSRRSLRCFRRRTSSPRESR